MRRAGTRSSRCCWRCRARTSGCRGGSSGRRRGSRSSSVRWPARCGCGHEFIADELVAVGKPVDHQVEELPRLAALVTEHQCPGSLPGLWQA
jgi:hypothetical protein